MSAVLRAEKLSVTLAETGAALTPEISFTLGAGGALALVGISGSGKTMCVNAILGLLNKRVFRVSGRASFADRSLFGLSEREMRALRGGRLALIPQNPMTAFDPSARLGSQLAETVRAHRDVSRRAARELSLGGLRALGLP
ncbi:MAG: ATP-binding cassette domain-containing protein, partial [Oscillospiraceae bacterium]|nr:ATP-binding cassette domain-containing protein [Oscillospiraceae bacterium]